MFKKIIIGLFATFLTYYVTIANSTFYIGLSEVSISSATAENCLVINFREVSKIPIHVQFLDENGDVLQTNNVKGKKNYTLQYHLNQLEKGTYLLHFETTTSEYIQPIEITKDGAKILSNRLIERFKPAFRFEDNLLSINAYNKSLKPIIVEIIDKDGYRLLRDETENVVAYGKRFNLNNWAKDDYFVTVRLEGKVYSLNINR